MAQTHDVMIDGAGYMLLPGSYKYQNKGADITPIRTGVPSFDQRLGARPTLPSERDRDSVRWTAVGMMPVPVGLGDELGRLMLAPKELVLVIGAAFDGNSRICLFNGAVYVTLATNLYRLTMTAGALTSLTFIGAAAGTITSMCISGGLLMMATTGATMSNYAGSGAIANSPAVKAQVIWDYARGIWRSKQDPGTFQWDTASGSADGGATWTDFRVDSTIRSACVWHGRATGGGVTLLGTTGMLWELAGQWSGSPSAFSGTVSPVFDGRGGGGTDDFAWMVEHEGYIYTWYAGTVHRWNGSRLEPIGGGPRGTIDGMTVAGGHLCVSVADLPTGEYLVWCYDGVRWWILARSTTPYGTIGGTSGIVGDGHLVSLNYAASLSHWQMPVVSFSANPAASGQVIAGPFDAGEPDQVKVWNQVTLAWSTLLYAAGLSSPANPGGNLLCEYSVDDGVNYLSLGSVAVAVGGRSSLATWTFPGQGVEAQRLLTRVTWTPTSAYAGLQLDGLHVSGWLVRDRQRDERWQFTIKCTDKLVKRDGSLDARSGETMLQALRALAQAGRTFVFQDVDFDLNARNVTARVLDLQEKERKGDGTHFLESQITLTIAAVA